MSKMFFNMLAVFAKFEAGLLKMRTREGVRALVISQAGEKRVVRLAEPLLHQPLRAGDSLLLESWSGYVYERITKAEAEELILEEGERDKLGKATPRAPQGPEATAARTPASCVDDVDDDQGVAVVEIEAVAQLLAVVCQAPVRGQNE